jgi:hypothetical protein
LISSPILSGKERNDGYKEKSTANRKVRNWHYGL